MKEINYIISLLNLLLAFFVALNIFNPNKFTICLMYLTISILFLVLTK